MNEAEEGKNKLNRGPVEYGYEPPAVEKQEEQVEPAEFPLGFWKRVDYLLHHPRETVESIRRGTDLAKIAGILFTTSVLMALIYGMVMGATNLLQGSQMATGSKFLMVLTTGIKVPVLFLLTLIIVFPPIYVSNSYVGAKLSFLQMLTLMVSAVAVMSTVLASGATIAFFFALTSRSYHFIKLLHVLIFAFAGLSGLLYLARGVMRVSLPELRNKMKNLFVMWLIIYSFVGLELTWVMRPFIGSPGEQFTLFRKRKGNIYESVFTSLEQWVRNVGED